MDTPLEAFNTKFVDLLQEAASHDLHTEDATTAMKNLKTFSECQPHEPTPEPELVPDPTTVWGKFKCGVARVWESETTRVCIKAAGAFAGVALVAHQTIRQDRVLERQAMNQANQNNK